jgi:ketosteroid isomerase-like protein
VITGYYAVAMSERPAQLREAYHALGRGDLDPWMRLLDPKVVWRATDQPDVPDTPI